MACESVLDRRRRGEALDPALAAHAAACPVCRGLARAAAPPGPPPPVPGPAAWRARQRRETAGRVGAGLLVAAVVAVGLPRTPPPPPVAAPIAAAPVADAAVAAAPVDLGFDAPVDPLADLHHPTDLLEAALLGPESL